MNLIPTSLHNIFEKMVKLAYLLIFAYAASHYSYRLKGLARRKMRFHHTKTRLTGLTELTDHNAAASYNDFLSLLFIAKYETRKIRNTKKIRILQNQEFDVANFQLFCQKIIFEFWQTWNSLETVIFCQNQCQNQCDVNDL